MAEKTNPESKPVPEPVTIDNPEQASTNFYWKYLTSAGNFNLQTTIRGTLTYEQIVAHINSALAAASHVTNIGGLAKQVGRDTEEAPSVPLPQVSVAQSVPAGTALPVVPQVQAPIPQAPVVPQTTAIPQPPAAQVQAPQQPAELSFISQKLICEIKNNKHYFKITGGRWPKYGVTIWDEVLVAAGINPNLEGQTYDFAGYKATYTLKANGDPEKIIKLEKVA